MELNLTEEERIIMSVSAAFDSVNLISELKSLESLTEEQENTLVRNVEHLQLMLQKSWFTNILTEQQLIDINNCL